MDFVDDDGLEHPALAGSFKHRAAQMIRSVGLGADENVRQHIRRCAALLAAAEDDDAAATTRETKENADQSFQHLDARDRMNLVMKGLVIEIGDERAGQRNMTPYRWNN